MNMRGIGLIAGVVTAVVVAGDVEASGEHNADLSSSAATRTYDLVIYGSSPAALSAAVQARRMGCSCVIVSPETRIGGLTTGGLGCTDIGAKWAYGGIAREFYRDVKRYYADDANWKWQKRDEYDYRGIEGGYPKHAEEMWLFEPSAALAILERWERENRLDIVRGARLNRGPGGVKVREGRITEFRTMDGTVYRGKVFVDATYEGDLLAAAGVSYAVGREDNATYGETLNGAQPMVACGYHRFEKGVDPYVRKGDPASGLLPGIDPEPMGTLGKGDRRVQAYCYRMCLTDKPENRIPFVKPAGYDERDYELLFRNYECGAEAHGMPWLNSAMPNRKTDTNNRKGFSTDFIGRNWDYPEASYAERERIEREHLHYQQGLMWTLANHPRIPEKVRAEVSRWGVCKDEFRESAGWPTQLYVREARRMIGEYVMTERDCRGERIAPNPVALGSYQMDSHNVRRYVGGDGFVQNEGDVEAHLVKHPYGIGYGAIVPKRGDCANLLVPVCLSASHIAFGSIRMEPVFFALGQVAGTAAAQAIAAGCAVQDIPYASLRERLLADGQVLEWKGGGVSGGVSPALGFDLVRDGKSVVSIECPPYEEGLSDVVFFTNAVARCTGATMKTGVVDCARIVFKVERRPILSEDDWQIDFPDARTLRISGTPMSCRWALNWILEECFGCCFCFPGHHGSHYPKSKTVTIPCEPRAGTMGFRIHRELYREDPAWQRAMGGKRASGNLMGHNLKHFLPIKKYAKDPWREKIMPEINGRRIVPKYPGKAWNNCYASEESVAESITNICAYLRAHPEKNVYSLSINDNSGHCQCAGCRALNGGTFDEPCRFGSKGHTSLSKAYYTWVNRVAAGVAAEFPDVMLGLLAYRNTIDPPSFKLHPNVVPFLCVDTSQLVEPKRIENRRRLFAEWSACVRNFGQWDYAYGFRYKPARVYLKTMNDFYKWKKDFPAFGGVFAEGDTYMGEGPKRWWHYKLMANPEADMEATLSVWYEACCGRTAAPSLKAYYALLESYWTGVEIRKTDWFKNTNGNTYLNFSEDTYLHALPRDLMVRAGALMRDVVSAAERDGDADQKWRAARLMEYHDLYAARCVWNGAGHLRPDGTFADDAAAANYIRMLPEMCEACNTAIRLADRLEETRRVEMGWPLPLIDPNAKRVYSGWGVSVLANPNFPFSMNEALGYLGRDVFANALVAAARDARLFPDYAEVLRSLVDLSRAPDCAYGEITTAAEDIASWSRKRASAARAVAVLEGWRYRLTNVLGKKLDVVKSIGGLERGYYLFRTRVKNESPQSVVASISYHSASPNWGDTDPVGLRASARIMPGATKTLSVFCCENQCQASLGYHVSGLKKGTSVVIEKLEFLRLAVQMRREALAEAANPGRLDAARAESEVVLGKRREDRKIKMWAKKTGITVEAFKAFSEGERSLVRQAFSCKMRYADYKALTPSERKAKLEEVRQNKTRKRTKK